MSSSLFVRLMQAALDKHQHAKTPDDRRAAEAEMAQTIRLNFHGDLDTKVDPKLAAAGKDE